MIGCDTQQCCGQLFIPGRQSWLLGTTEPSWGNGSPFRLQNFEDVSRQDPRMAESAPSYSCSALVRILVKNPIGPSSSLPLGGMEGPFSIGAGQWVHRLARRHAARSPVSLLAAHHYLSLARTWPSGRQSLPILIPGQMILPTPIRCGQTMELDVLRARVGGAVSIHVAQGRWRLPRPLWAQSFAVWRKHEIPFRLKDRCRNPRAETHQFVQDEIAFNQGRVHQALSGNGYAEFFDHNYPSSHPPLEGILKVFRSTYNKRLLKKVTSWNAAFQLHGTALVPVSYESPRCPESRICPPRSPYRIRQFPIVPANHVIYPSLFSPSASSLP